MAMALKSRAMRIRYGGQVEQFLPMTAVSLHDATRSRGVSYCDGRIVQAGSMTDVATLARGDKVL